MGDGVILEKCLSARSITLGKFDFTNGRKEGGDKSLFSPSKIIFFAFFNIVTWRKKKKKGSFFQWNRKKMELSALSLGENNIYCHSTWIL